MKNLSEIILHLLLSALPRQYDFTCAAGIAHREECIDEVCDHKTSILQSRETAVNGNLIDLFECCCESACK